MISVNEKGELDYNIKGAVFKGKNKALITKTALENVLKEILRVYEPSSDVKKLIDSTARQVTMKINIDEIPVSQLVLIQNIKSPKSYTSKSNKERAVLLEEFLKQPISGTYSDGFLVCKTPLPGAVVKGNKPRQRPIMYMKPADYVKKNDIDLHWYKEMILDFILAAFGMRGKNKHKGPAIIEGQVSLVDFM